MNFKTWLESVEHRFGDKPDIMEMMLREAPHTRFPGSVPPELGFLKGEFVDLGFENLGGEGPKCYRAFGGKGVRVPGTKHRLRNDMGVGAVVEPADGSEDAELPGDWKQCVLVVAHGNTLSYIGKKVRPDQHGISDLEKQYTDDGEGWVLKAH